MGCREEELTKELMDQNDICKHSCENLKSNKCYQEARDSLGQQSCADLKTNKYSMVIDLEMCRVHAESEFGYSHEIIQIGAVIVNEGFDVVSEFSTYVCPEYGKLDGYITRLTGIEEANVAAAPKLETAMKMFLLWMDHFKIEKIYAWSNNDYSQLYYELNHKKLMSKGVSDLLEPDLWVDYQDVFGKRYGYGRAVSLEDALMYSQIFQTGRAHNGLDDAINTALLIQKLEMHPEYKPCVKAAAKANEDRLTFTLGDKMLCLLAQVKAVS